MTYITERTKAGRLTVQGQGQHRIHSKYDYRLDRVCSECLSQKRKKFQEKLLTVFKVLVFKTSYH